MFPLLLLECKLEPSYSKVLLLKFPSPPSDLYKPCPLFQVCFKCRLLLEPLPNSSSLIRDFKSLHQGFLSSAAIRFFFLSVCYPVYETLRILKGVKHVSFRFQYFTMRNDIFVHSWSSVNESFRFHHQFCFIIFSTWAFPDQSI